MTDSEKERMKKGEKTLAIEEKGKTHGEQEKHFSFVFKGDRRKKKKRGKDSKADELGSFGVTTGLCLQTTHGQHTKHQTQCTDPDSCQ